MLDWRFHECRPLERESDCDRWRRRRNDRRGDDLAAPDRPGAGGRQRRGDFHRRRGAVHAGHRQCDRRRAARALQVLVTRPSARVWFATAAALVTLATRALAQTPAPDPHQAMPERPTVATHAYTVAP